MTNTSTVKKVYLNGYAKEQILFHDDRLLKVLSIAQSSVPKKTKRMLDIGCGDGSFTKILGRTLEVDEMYGICIAPDAIREASNRQIKAEVFDADSGQFPYPSSYFNFIYCGNLVELVADADHLLKEIHRLLKEDGKVIMTFPNIASWLSRIALFLGYLPYYSRVSTQFDLGKMFSKTKRGQSSGFIRLFTPPAFSQLAKFYGLKVEKILGVGEKTLPKPFQIIDKILTLRPSFAFYIICVLTKT